MKLLETFKRQIVICGDIKRVWLTSFNIDIEFIETFIVPAVLGMDPPRTLMDYEEMQQVLNDRGIDFKIFCDKRYINTHQVKRTLIPIHGISLAKWGTESYEQGFTKKSLFHAKVILIEGEKSRVIGAGSANLTVSGWGRNREVFQFVPIHEKPLYESIQNFFQVIFNNISLTYPLENLDNFSKQQPSEPSAVRFCHSFQSERFIEQLLGSEKHQELVIWSPYFSKDLAVFIDYLYKTCKQVSMEVHLVPDRVEGQYLRTSWTKDLGDLLLKGECGLTLYQFPDSGDSQFSMTHAKLWKTSSHLAIGSWNCTFKGANLTEKNNKKWVNSINLEAGLIFKDEDKTSKYYGEKIEANEDCFASKEQLDAEALEVPEVLPFDLEVKFDWATSTYHLMVVWNEISESAVTSNKYSVRLPDLDKPIALRWDHSVKPIEKSEYIANPKDLIRNHRYEVLEEDKHCGSGLIIELSAVSRRVQQYDDLKSLLDSMMVEGLEPSIENTSYIASDFEEQGFNLDGYTTDSSDDNKIEKPDISYFRLFAATHQYATRLHELNSMKSLEQWAFTRPGCLKELIEKSQKKISKSELKPNIFNLFLAQEVNSLCDLAKQLRSKRLSSDYNDEGVIPAERWNELVIELPELSTLPIGTNDEYLEYIKKSIKNGERCDTK